MAEIPCHYWAHYDFWAIFKAPDGIVQTSQFIKNNWWILSGFTPIWQISATDSWDDVLIYREGVE